MDEATGNSSRLIDLPNGGFSIIMGNLLMQGVNAVNNNLVEYGLEGLTNPISEVYIVNNTFVNKRAASCIFIDIKAGTSVAQVINNIFAGKGTLVKGVTTKMTNNINELNISAMKFVDEPNYNYNIALTSPAINAGNSLGSVSGYSLIPTSVYVHPLNFTNRTVINAIDCGAYEFNNLLNSESFENKLFNIYPNPIATVINIGNFDVIDKVQIIDLLGKIIKELKPNSSVLNLENLEKGIYIISIEIDNIITSTKIIKL